jgi:hypothetical protein
MDGVRAGVFGLLVALLFPSGCAQEVGLIDRTQPGLMKKSVLEGEWLLRRTVIDVPYDAGYTFIGESEDAMRVTFDVQKDFLIVMRSHPLVENTPDSTPVAVFAIKKHADILREYNAATGEQSNVLVENTTDRAWYERDFIRVDWSKNLVTNFSFWIEQLEQEPVGFFVEDAADENRPLLGVKESNGGWRDYQSSQAIQGLESADYLDVVTKMFVKPETFLVEDWDGSLLIEPACWYYLNYDCAPGIITIRSAFLKVDASTTDYEPLSFPDNSVARDKEGKPIRVKWNAQGDRERITKEDEILRGDASAGNRGDSSPDNPYGTDDGSVVRLPFFDKFGYFRTERFGYDEAYGEVHSDRIFLINRWNIWEKSHDETGALLPYAERGYRPIVYYLSPDFPAGMRASAQSVIDQWNDSLRETVRELTGVAPPRLFELRDNTRNVDAETGALKRRGEVIGDLRYSHLYLVSEPTRAGLLGYGPAAADPMTGEIVAADAYIYGAVAKEVAAKGRDIVELMNGKLSPEEFALGENIKQYLATLKAGGSSSAKPSRKAIEAFADSHRGAAPPKPSGARSKFAPKGPSKPGDFKMKGIEKLKRPAGWASSRLQLVRNTPVETLLTGDKHLRVMKGMGLVSPQAAGGALPEAIMKHVSPASWASMERRKLSLEHFRSFSRRNMMMATFFDDAVAGLALKHKDTDSKDLLNILTEDIIMSTAEHEVGHTLGLRHNFEASTDALNYHDDYWTLRGDNPQPMTAMTDAESKGQLREYQYSSIMDYHGRFNTDTQGLSHYDRAAIKFGYGQLVEAFENPVNEPMLSLVDYGNDQYDRPFTLDKVLRELRHYTKIPGMLGGVANISKRKNVPYTNHVASLMGLGEEASYEAQLTGDAPYNSVEVPYRFCSDEYVDGTATCHAFDLGADAYEFVDDTIQRYWTYYWFNNFQRDRVFFDQWDYMDRMWWRYFAFILNSYQNWVFDQWFRAETWDWVAETPETWGVENKPWTKALDGGLVKTAAVMKGMTFIQQVLALPEPGAYMYDFDDGYYWAFHPSSLPPCDGVWAFNTSDWCSDANLELGQGRHLYSIYDWESGYYFYERLKWVGTFYDKLLALDVLTNPATLFLGVESAESIDEWAISMYLTFPKEIQRIFGGIAADRFDMFAGVIEEDNWTYVPPDPFAEAPAEPVVEPPAPVDPATSFTIQLYGLWYGMAWLNANYDNSFNNFAKIWLEGSGEALVPVDPASLIRFENPFNNRVYVTMPASGEATYGVGQLMLEQANAHKALWEASATDPAADPDTTDYYKWKVDNITENIEVVRGLYDLYGYLYF